MKKTLIFGILAAAFLVACESAPKSDEAKIGEAQEVNKEQTAEAKDLKVDIQTSLVSWVGTKPVGKHNGTFNIKEGVISVKDGNIAGGNFIIDVASLKVLDIPAEDEMNGKLAGHLSSGDFFDVEKFPSAKFEIVKVDTYKAEEGKKEEKDPEYTLTNPTHLVTGNLELKGVTKSITFPAKITVNGNSVDAEAKFNINRKDWGMDYGSDAGLGDKMINPTVHIGFKIVAQ